MAYKVRRSSHGGDRSRNRSLAETLNDGNDTNGGHQPTPLQNWNRYKTSGEKSKEYARNVENEVRANGGNPDVLGNPYADPYDGSTIPSGLNNPAWEQYEDDHRAMIEKGNEPETEHGDYYERQISDDAKRD